MIIRQSDLSSFSYCAMRQQYDLEAEFAGREAPRLSATIYGTVIHFAGQVLQREIHAATPDELAAGAPDALKKALVTFEHYWQPEHTAEISEGPPTIWTYGQTWAGMLNHGRTSLMSMHEWLVTGPGKKDILLATELPFNIPIELDGEEHVVHGTVDRLALRTFSGKLYLAIDDLKSGIKPDHLQYAMQWTVYSWASEHASFWATLCEFDEFEEVLQRLASRGFDLFRSPEGLELLPRRGRWINLKMGKFSTHETGLRTEGHYQRMRLAMSQFIKARRADVHPLTTDTKKCNFCNWRDVCGDAPLPALQEDVDVRLY